jgi:glycosyltransferase involved in cell wall biosynthesis
MGYDGNIAIIPNGVSLVELERPPDVGALARAIIVRKRVLLFMGRIHPVKGLDLLIRAFAEIHEVHPDTVLVVAGPDEDADYRERVRTLASELVIDNSVIFVGMVTGPERLALLHSATVFALPLHSEGLPLAILEAAACRVPVVISELCNLAEFGQLGAGVVVRPDVPSIVQGLLLVLANEDERRVIGE